jgi:peroxiredoxin
MEKQPVVQEQRTSFNRLIIVVAGLWIGVLLGAGLIGGMIYFKVGPFADSTTSAAEDFAPTARMEDGTLATDFELEDVNGQKLRLSDLRGQVVVVNYWATWCVPCVREMPTFQSFQYQYPNFTMISIDQLEDAKSVQDFVKERAFDYRILLDKNGKVAEKYKVSYLPTTFFIDERGMIRYRHYGSMSEEQLSHYLQTLGVIPQEETQPGGTP